MLGGVDSTSGGVVYRYFESLKKVLKEGDSLRTIDFRLPSVILVSGPIQNRGSCRVSKPSVSLPELESPPLPPPMLGWHGTKHGVTGTRFGGWILAT